MNNQLLKINIQSTFMAICLILGVTLDISAKPTIDGFNPIELNIGSLTGEFGDIVCVDVTADNFIRVEGMQFSINYNSNLLSIICPVDVTNSPLDQTELFFNCFDDDGTVRVFWTDPNSTEADGVTIPNGDVLFSLCFEIVGTCGLNSPVIFTSDPLPIEIYQISEAGVSCENQEIIVNEGSVGISCSDMIINAFRCNASTANDDGTLSFYVAGGSGSYNYTVIPGGFMGTIGESEWVRLEGLSSNNYTITATDNNSGEVINQNIFISDIGAIQVTLEATDPYCFNRDKGFIETKVTNSFGDELVANYEWSTFQFTQDIDNLGSGTYTVTVTDLSGCSATESATLYIESLILHAELLDSASCQGNNDAVVKIWAEGGTPFPPMPTNPEYKYETDAGNIGPIDTIFLNNVETGIFNFSVIDAAIPLCQVDSFIDIPFIGVDLSIELDVTNISCFGADDGSVTIKGIGSTNFGFIVRDDMNMLIAGAGTPTKQTFPDLSPGCYTVTVIESFNGCEISDAFCLEEPTELVLLTDNVINPGCIGNDGVIQLTPTGGTSPYEFMWSDGPSTAEDRNGLIGGMYQVTLTDNHGCTDIASFDLPNGEDIEINSNIIQAINCPQDENGIIEVVIASGDTFTYNWELSDGTFVSDMQTVSNLGSGVYYVTATDATGSCTALDTVVLAVASPITVEGNFTEPTCPGVPNGVIGIVHIEGTSPFEYLWEDGSMSQVLSGVTEGTYDVTITDNNQCELDTFLTLSVQNPIGIDFTDIVGVDCFGSNNGSITATANGGPEMAGTYTYFWSNDPANGVSGITSSQSNFPAGENWVIATDFFCASDTVFFTIPNIDSIAIDIVNSVFNSPSCFGDCDGTIEIVTTGGNPSSYNYTWLDNNSNNSMRIDLCAGLYDLMITDANGCNVTRSIELLNPMILSTKIDSLLLQEVSCNENNGELAVETTGGTEPYTYMWTDNVSTNKLAKGLSAGTYNIIVTDDNNCTAETSYTLVAPEPVMVVLGDIAEPNCFGELTCISIESVTGGVGNDYTFTITPDGFRFPIDSCVAVYADEHLITVFDSTGFCSWETTITIDQPDEIMVDAGPNQEIDLGSASDIISPIINSTLPVTDVSWSPMDSLECKDADCEDVISNTQFDQLYTVTVVDENGCSAMDDILITVNKSRNVYIANIFTPNGDGTNDYFNLVIGSGAVSISYLSIYDRWGNSVFSIENEYIPEIGQQDGWDGKHNGQYVNPGVYVYTAQVNFLDGIVLQYSGDITVIR